MSNSSLINYTLLSPNYSKRIFPISKITIHHAVAIGVSSMRIAETFLPLERKASANYTIGVNGDITLVVPEEFCAWTSGTWNGYDNGNDGIAVTIEVANDGGEPDWHVSDKTLEAIINLCVDICKRNNIEALNFTGDATGNLTQHNYFQPTRCPGEYLKTKFSYIADEVNKRLGNNVIISDSIDVFYAAYANQWLDEVKNYNEINDDGYAGWHGRPMTGIKARLSEGSIVYRVHTLHNGWLDWVTDYDESQGGYAGIYGQPIDGIQMYLKNLPENYHVEYRVGLLGGGPQPWIRDYEENTWSGTFGKQFDKFQIRIIADPIYVPIEKKEEEVVHKEIYRVRASWDDALSQIGAFTNLDSAIIKAKEYGYNVYNSNGEVVYETPIIPKENPYDVYLYLNDGTDDCVEMLDQEGLITLPIVEREGFEFIGWNTEIDGSGETYYIENEVEFAAGCSLYAMWEELEIEEPAPVEPPTTEEPKQEEPIPEPEVVDPIPNPEPQKKENFWIKLVKAILETILKWFKNE